VGVAVSGGVWGFEAAMRNQFGGHAIKAAAKK
jgi:hypothetical protein